jgi:hypothetical protein
MALYNSSGGNRNQKPPNTATVTEASIGTAPGLIAIDRSVTGNRRGLTIENEGPNSIFFSYGTSVSETARTIQLFPGDYFEDVYNWQGPVTAISTGITTANVTELVII